MSKKLQSIRCIFVRINNQKLHNTQKLIAKLYQKQKPLKRRF